MSPPSIAASTQLGCRGFRPPAQSSYHSRKLIDVVLSWDTGEVVPRWGVLHNFVCPLSCRKHSRRPCSSVSTYVFVRFLQPRLSNRGVARGVGVLHLHPKIPCPPPYAYLVPRALRYPSRHFLPPHTCFFSALRITIGIVLAIHVQDRINLSKGPPPPRRLHTPLPPTRCSYRARTLSFENLKYIQGWRSSPLVGRVISEEHYGRKIALPCLFQSIQTDDVFEIEFCVSSPLSRRPSLRHSRDSAGGLG